jgi:DNA-binding transcriptional LysR family regulator
MLDLYKLQIFAVVVEVGSFSAAAERLYMTQPAISQHIKALEVSLGRELFERGWRGVKLTAHGETLHRYTERIFALVHEAENALINVDGLASGRISLGATPGVGVYLAPEWVQAFREGYPQLTVALKTGITSEIVADVAARRLDIGFVEGELDPAQIARLGVLVLEPVEQRIVVGRKHAFWEREHLMLADLHEQSFIVRQVNSQSRLWLESVFQHYGLERHIGAEFDNLESMKRAVILGNCLAVMPDYVVQAECEQGLLRLISVAGKPFTRELKLIWEAQTPFSPVTRVFLTELSRIYPALGPLIA